MKMKLKKWLKLSAPLLALMLATACSNGQEEVNPQDEPAGSELNEEDVPVDGGVETEEPASDDAETEEPASEDAETEEPASDDAKTEEPAASDLEAEGETSGDSGEETPALDEESGTE